MMLGGLVDVVLFTLAASAVLQPVIAWSKGLEPPIKHHKAPIHGNKHLKYCKANVTCPEGHVPYEAVYLTAYVNTKADRVTGHYEFISKYLNKYGQFTLTDKQEDAVIALPEIPAQQADGFANAGQIKTYNADYPHYNHIGAVLGYGSNSSYILFDGHFNYYALSPTTTTKKYAKPVSSGYSAYAYFTGINAPKEESIWSIVYHTFGAPGHIYPVWYNPVWGQETSNSLWWFPKENAIFGFSNYQTFAPHFNQKEYKEFFPIDITPQSIHGFVKGAPNHPPP